MDGLKVFEKFIPIDDEAPADCRHIDGPLNYQDIQERFDEQRGIDFQKFYDEAQRIRDMHDTLQDLHETTETSLNSLFQEWAGAGANVAYQKYSEDIAPNTQNLLEYLQGGPDVIEAAVETVFEACKDKAEAVLDLYTPAIGSAPPGIASKIMKLTRGEFEEQEEALEVAAWVDQETGSNLVSTLESGDCGLNDENKEYTIGECRNWIRQS